MAWPNEKNRGRHDKAGCEHIHDEFLVNRKRGMLRRRNEEIGNRRTVKGAVVESNELARKCSREHRRHFVLLKRDMGTHQFLPKIWLLKLSPRWTDCRCGGERRFL